MTQAVLIYDHSCSLCRRSVAWLSRRALPGAFEFLPCQAAERRARYPQITERACMDAMQLVLPDGRVLAGTAAAPEILGRLRRWRRFALLFRIPLIRVVAAHGYGWIARRRHRVSSRAGVPDNGTH